MKIVQPNNFGSPYPFQYQAFRNETNTVLQLGIEEAHFKALRGGDRVSLKCGYISYIKFIASVKYN